MGGSTGAKGETGDSECRLSLSGNRGGGAKKSGECKGRSEECGRGSGDVGFELPRLW